MAWPCAVCPHRLARDFWVMPEREDGPPLVPRLRRQTRLRRRLPALGRRRFSGILCVDEVYQGDLALLLAVDPPRPRVIAWSATRWCRRQRSIRTTVSGLPPAACGPPVSRPTEVITDGSPLYPSVLAEVWPAAVHQLCLFHETRRVVRGRHRGRTRSVRTLPEATTGAVSRPCSAAADDHPADRVQRRSATLALALARPASAGIAQVHALRQHGLSVRAIDQQTGFNRGPSRLAQAARRQRPRGRGVPASAQHDRRLPMSRRRHRQRRDHLGRSPPGREPRLKTAQALFLRRSARYLSDRGAVQKLAGLLTGPEPRRPSAGARLPGGDGTAIWRDERWPADRPFTTPRSATRSVADRSRGSGARSTPPGASTTSGPHAAISAGRASSCTDPKWECDEQWSGAAGARSAMASAPHLRSRPLSAPSMPR